MRVRCNYAKVCKEHMCLHQHIHSDQYASGFKEMEVCSKREQWCVIVQKRVKCVRR